MGPSGGRQKGNLGISHPLNCAPCLELENPAPSVVLYHQHFPFQSLVVLEMGRNIQKRNILGLISWTEQIQVVLWCPQELLRFLRLC